MMAFLAPGLFVLSLLLVPILLLYMLRLRRQEVIVSSIMLWDKLLRDREANAPWQRLRRNLLLILQLLILFALVIALARPFLPVPTIASGNVVVLLDGSASMLATDSTPNRFAEAQIAAARVIANLRGDDQVTLILVSRDPRILAASTNDRTLLNDAVYAAQAMAVEADWDSALALAAGAAQGYEEARVVIISDGGLPDGSPPIPAEVNFIQVGSDGANLAISALETRSTGNELHLFARVTNYGNEDHPTLISIDVDGYLQESRQIVLPGNSGINLTWTLPEDSQIIQARLSGEDEDPLDEDNRAWTIPEDGDQRRVLLLSKGNRFLETVFSTLPGFQLFRTPSDSDISPEQADEYDLVVYDSVPVPSPLPAADLLIINPQPGDPAATGETTPLLDLTGIFSATGVIRLADSPILQHVDWSNVNIRQAARVGAPWGQAIIEAEGGPLLLSGEHNGQRIVILTFALQESDLPLQIAFPVLMANITGWLSPGRVVDTPDHLSLGDPLRIFPDGDTEAVVIIKPDGSRWTEKMVDSPILFAETDQLGVYEVLFRATGAERLAGRFAINFLSPMESAIEPKESIRLGPTDFVTPEEGDIGQREFWPHFATLAFIILLIEWWIYHHGARLPRWPLIGYSLKRNN